MGGRGMACHARPCGGGCGVRRGVDVIDVDGEEDPPPHPPCRKAEPPGADTGPPASKAPGTSTPAERAARERPRECGRMGGGAAAAAAPNVAGPRDQC